MNTSTISTLMLERYRLGELNAEDHNTITAALADDDELRLRLEKLNESDKELRLHYPAETTIENLRFPRRRFPRFVHMAVAAAIVLAVAFPIFRFVSLQIEANNAIAVASGNPIESDRPKGNALADSELALYLKGNHEVTLPNQAVLQEGNTVQLAYTVPAKPEHYGIIFSIDGKSAVTMHYPYRRGQSSLLVSGRRTFLNEAYILDDAPGYEVFVFVFSEEPLDADTVLYTAQEIAAQKIAAQEIAGESWTTIEEKSKALFTNCEVETITILKK